MRSTVAGGAARGLLGMAAAVLLGSTIASAQGTPVPVPTGPGGAATPIYVQPTPAPASTEPSPSLAPEPVTAPPASAPSPGVQPGEAGQARPDRYPQVTSFPEITLGIGDSEALLSDQ